MKAAYVIVLPNEQALLMGLFAMMYKAGQHTVDQGKVWVFLANKLTLKMKFSDEEIDLIQLAVGEVIKSGQKALERIPPERTDARIRASVVEKTYKNIQEKLNNVIYTEQPGQPVDQSESDVHGDDEKRFNEQDHHDPLTTGDSTTSGSD